MEIDPNPHARIRGVAFGLLLGLFAVNDVTAQRPVIGQSAKKQSSLKDLVTVETGELPIILSAPHGGQGSIPGVSLRKGVGVRQFRTTSDAYTGLLADTLADAIERQLGKRPYVVIARFHRKYLDANRRPEFAYESDEGKAVYGIYHQALSDARQEVVDRWGSGVLLDIHGQAAEPKAIIRGTQNGKTTGYLVQRFGREALVGQTSLFGQFASHGFPVIPPVGSSDDEHPNYNGGYIVRTYGSRAGGTLDAIQLEFGRELRTANARDKTAGKLARAIAAFTKDYLSLIEIAEDAGLDNRTKELQRP